MKDKNIIIPDKYKNLPVTKIESKAFYQNTNIESITIPQSIIEIGVDAFAECNKLTYNTYDNETKEVTINEELDEYNKVQEVLENIFIVKLPV